MLGLAVRLDSSPNISQITLSFSQPDRIEQPAFDWSRGRPPFLRSNTWSGRTGRAQRRHPSRAWCCRRQYRQSKVLGDKMAHPFMSNVPMNFHVVSRMIFCVSHRIALTFFRRGYDVILVWHHAGTECRSRCHQHATSAPSNGSFTSFMALKRKWHHFCRARISLIRSSLCFFATEAATSLLSGTEEVSASCIHSFKVGFSETNHSPMKVAFFGFGYDNLRQLTKGGNHGHSLKRCFAMEKALSAVVWNFNPAPSNQPPSSSSPPP